MIPQTSFLEPGLKRLGIQKGLKGQVVYFKMKIVLLIENPPEAETVLGLGFWDGKIMTAGKKLNDMHSQLNTSSLVYLVKIRKRSE